MGKRDTTTQSRAKPKADFGWSVGILAAVGWAWSLALLLIRGQSALVLHYQLAPTPDLTPAGALVASPLALNAGQTVLMILSAAGVVWAGRRIWRVGRRAWCLALTGAFWLPVVLEAVRIGGDGAPRSFLEFYSFALAAGLLAWQAFSCGTAASSVPAKAQVEKSASLEASGKKPAPRLVLSAWFWPAAVSLVAAGFAVYWFTRSCELFVNYQLGYFDFGHFARRVINTWEGRGFLMQEPGLPAFWDHFNPGLALLAPLWGLWPDARLFFVLQAASLALPAVFVYAIARRLGAGPAAAAAWGLTYLCLPAVGQMNLNFTYGWHPVSLAIPLLFAAAWALSARRLILAAVLAVLAASIKEDVLVALAGLCVGFAVLAWRQKKNMPANGAGMAPKECALRNWRGWLIAAGVWMAILVVVLKTMPFAQYQTDRWRHLGDSTGQILLSPILRPAAFWGQVLSWDSLCYLLAMLLPFVPALRRGWPVALALVLPMGVLLAWNADGAKCIAFQYNATLVVILMLVGMIGAVSGCEPCAVCRHVPSPADKKDMPANSARLALGAGMAPGMIAYALATAAVMATLIGAVPWSNDDVGNLQAEQLARIPAMDQAVALADRPGASVLATGRLAAHLLSVRRLEPVSDGFLREKSIAALEAPQGEMWLAAFDCLVLDRQEHLMQSAEQTRQVESLAAQCGYDKVFEKDDMVVYRRRGHGD